MAQYSNSEIGPDYSGISKYSQPALNYGLDNYMQSPAFNYSSGKNLGTNTYSEVLDSAIDPNAGNRSIFGGLKDILPDTGGKMFDWLNKDNMAIAGDVFKSAGSLWSAYNASKQNELAKDQFKFSKNAFNANFANQAKTINTQLEDRQRARIGGTGDNNAGGNYDSVNTYMDKNKINGAAI